MASATDNERELLDAGDALVDDLVVLLDTEQVEAIAETLGLDVTAHLEKWEAIAGAIDPRL